MPAEAELWGDVAVLIFAGDQTRMEDNLGLPKKKNSKNGEKERAQFKHNKSIILKRAQG